MKEDPFSYELFEREIFGRKQKEAKPAPKPVDPVESQMQKIREKFSHVPESVLVKIEESLRETSKPFAQKEAGLLKNVPGGAEDSFLVGVLTKTGKLLVPVVMLTGLWGMFPEAKAVAPEQENVRIERPAPETHIRREQAPPLKKHRKYRAQEEQVEELHEGRDTLVQTLETQVGADSVQRIKNLESVATEAERQRILEAGHATHVAGFENYKVSNEDVAKFCDTILPAGLSHNIKQITYEDRYIKLPDAYGIEGYEAAHADHLGNILVSKASEVCNRQQVLEMLAHEAGHRADWFNNKLLTLDERLELLSSVIDRLSARGRYNSSYVEKITNKDHAVETRMKAGEYFSEIMAAYLVKEDAFLPEEDVAIIEGFLAKTDPDFNVARARRKTSVLGREGEYREFMRPRREHSVRRKKPIRFSQVLLQQMRDVQVENER